MIILFHGDAYLESVETLIAVHNSIESNKSEISFAEAKIRYERGEPLAIPASHHSEGVWLAEIDSMDYKNQVLLIKGFTFCS